MVDASHSQATPFATLRFEDWRAGVERGLNGKSFDKRLVFHSAEGLAIQPLYPDSGALGEALNARGSASWSRREALPAGDLDAAVARMERAAHFGIDAFETTECAPADEAQLIANAARLNVALHFADPIDDKAALERLAAGLRGGQHVRAEVVRAELAAAWKASSARPALIVANSTKEQGQGAGEQLQVALNLWRGARWLRSASAGGLTFEEANECLEFQVSLGTDLFLEIAKLRALRLAWQKLQSACDASQAVPARIHARASLRAWTARDPWINGLRGTTIAFAAATGGADSVLIPPFDARLGAPAADALRLASNTHAILADESHLAAVHDPAAGSGYIESVTEALASGAWELFRQLDEQTEAQAADWIGAQIARSANAEHKTIATRRRGIIGVSEFPNLAEQLPQRAAGNPHTDVNFLAQPFEALRRASDETLARTGSRPAVFLANIGTQTEFRARADFARNLLAAGGIEAIDNEGFDTADAAIAAFKASGARLAVIASTDARYVDLASSLATGLQAAGALVVLAGHPGKHRDEWTGAGIAHFIHMGCDAAQTLRALHAIEDAQA